METWQNRILDHTKELLIHSPAMGKLDENTLVYIYKHWWWSNSTVAGKQIWINIALYQIVVAFNDKYCLYVPRIIIVIEAIYNVYYSEGVILVIFGP